MAKQNIELRKKVEALFDKKLYVEIIELLSNKVLKKESDGQLYAWRARAHDGKDEYDKLLQYSEQALAIDRNDPMVWFSLGNAYLRKKQFSIAIEKYEAAIALKPDGNLFSKIQSNIAKAYTDNGELDKAINYLNEAITRDRKNKFAYHELARIYLDKGDYNLALQLLFKALDIDSNFAIFYYDIGRAYNEKGEYDKSIEFYQKGLLLTDEDPDFYVGLGNSYSDKGENDKAVKYFKEAIDIDGKNKFAYNSLGVVCSDDGDYQKAIEYYNKAIEVDKEFHSAYFNIGVAYLRWKEYTKAISYYEEALRLKQDDGETLYGLGLAYEEIGSHKLAIEKFKRAVELNHRKAHAEARISTIKTLIEENLKKSVSDSIAKIQSIVNVIRQKSRTGKEVKLVVHYSKLNVADLVTSNRKSHLHYSNVIYMNDPQEGKTFIDYLKSDEIKKCFESGSYKNESSVFLGSFLPVHDDDTDGVAEDQLLMWRTYGKDEHGVDAAGCNFVIDTVFFETDDSKTPAPVPNAFEEIKEQIEGGTRFSDDALSGLLRVQYILRNEIQKDDSGLMKLLIEYLKEEVLKLIAQKNAADADEKTKRDVDSQVFKVLLQLCYLFKAADYSFEKEVRVIIDEPRISPRIEYYKQAVDQEPKPPKHFYVKSVKRILPYLKKIYLGPKVKDPSHWSLHFDYSLRTEYRQLDELETLEDKLKKHGALETSDMNRLVVLRLEYPGGKAGLKELIKANEIDIIPSRCQFV